jgi:hypothetical protein
MVKISYHVVSLFYLQSFKIDGENVIVKTEEFRFELRKYYRDYRIDIRFVNVQMIEKFFYQAVQNRKESTLPSIFRK